MIRINLLPTAKKKKKPLILPAPFMYGIASLLLLIIAAVSITFFINKHISNLKADIVVQEKKLDQLKVVLKKIENYEKDNEEFKRKADIIEQLKRNQIVPLVLLDEVSEVLPKGVWLTKLTDKARFINIEGYAYSNNDLVGYVQNLKSLKFFQDVML
ncbi:MAG TPA: hypothetical protein ENH18_03810, partial [Nitrospirae bacterium]|nr:hypothetical protein [Nitrospirota bacterium]HEW81478.1 hypothetical protein [Nitrospirota bacterium]